MEVVFQAVLIGVLQGLTEFIPISSSAHLELAPWIAGWQQDGLVSSLAFDVFLHLGTLTALIAYFWRDWVRLARAFFGSLRERRIGADPDRRAGLAAGARHDPGRHHRLRRGGLHQRGPAR